MSTDKGERLVQSDGADAGPGFPDCREDFEAGDKNALLWVVMTCAQSNWKMPEWAREALYDIYWRGASAEIESWDEVFGKPWRRGQRRTAQTWAKQPDIWLRVRKLHKAGASINNELFERVGKEFGMSRKMASELYYAIQRRFTKEDEKSFGI